MLIMRYNGAMGDDIPELLRWFEEQYADPSLPGGILKKVVHYGKPIRIQYFVNWPAHTEVSPTFQNAHGDSDFSDVGEMRFGLSVTKSEKPERRYNRASRVRVIRG